MPEAAALARRSRLWRRLGIAAVILVPIMLAVLVGVLVQQLGVNRLTRERLEESYRLREGIQNVFSLVQDVETGARGYVITGRDDFLQPYNIAAAELPVALATLRRRALTENDAAHLSQLDTLIRRKLELSEQMIGLRRDGRAQDADRLVNTGEGKAVMDQLRIAVGAWRAEQQRELDVRFHQAQRSDARLTVVVITLSLGVVFLLFVAASVTLRSYREGIATARALAERRDEAEAAKRAAQTANEAKSTFLAMMSHELRTPLNGVLGMAQMLTLTKLDERQRQCVEVISSSGSALLLLLNDILDLSKVEAGKLRIEAVSFELRPLIEGAAALWAPAAAEKGVELRVELPASAPEWVTGDPTRLRQVLTNLLSNAIKFTDQGFVTLSATYDAQELAFEVTDSGIGISPDAIGALFQDFSQAEAATSRKFGGTGLGLSISRKLCRMMGGDLFVRSTEGEGSTFYGSVSLPEASPAEQSARTYDDALPPLRILAVDDNATNRTVVRTLLEALGAEVTLADNGAEALEALRSEAFDLVLMDVNMPVMGGVEALKAIRQGAAGRKDIPVIALTADAMAGHRDQYMADGFDEHLGKPIQIDELMSAIGRALEPRPDSQPAAYSRATSSIT